jgi:hypothetical protein
MAAEEDAPASAATRLRLREDSDGYHYIEQAREVQPGSDDERALARRVSQSRDMHQGVSSLAELAQGVSKAVKAGRWVAGLLACAIAANPILASLLPDSREAEVRGQLEAVSAKLDEGRLERRALAAWLWDIEQCRRGDKPCPDAPPAPVRLMLAQDEIENGR